MPRAKGGTPRSAGRGRARKPVKSPAAGADNSRGTRPGGFELSELRQLIRLVQRTGIGELEVAAGGRTVRISAHTGAAPATAVTAAAAPAAAPAASSPSGGPAGTEHRVAIVSPMVGTFYRAPAPDADPYVEVGDVVEVGQTVCIIEAMKLMNEIESEVKGRVVRILVENAQPVEYGQKLFLIEP
ncbi:MAG: acetyl-CoA carboxylase biotin carboxyl carrier protein [Candidatus Eisenbacteria bacterium]